MDIFAVRTALAAAARAATTPAGIAKLTATAYAPDAVTVPHFYVGDYTINYDRAMRRGLDEIEFACPVLVSRAYDQAAQRLLDRLLSGSGPGSLKTAIEVARGLPGQAALDGAADDLHVMRTQGMRLYTVGSTEYLGAELIIKVIGEG